MDERNAAHGGTCCDANEYREEMPIEALRDVAGGARVPIVKYVCGSCGYVTSSTIDITGKRCVKCTEGTMRRYIV